MLRACSLAVCLGALAAPAPVCADDAFSSDPEPVLVAPDPVHTWSDPRMLTSIGVGVTIGGGLFGFTDRGMRRELQGLTGGSWHARITVGTHIPLGVEIAYVGSAQDVELGGPSDDDAVTRTLLGTAGEAALRWTIFPQAAGTPYAFAGAGWQRYHVRNAGSILDGTGIEATSQGAVFPLGIGVAYRDESGWVGDIRGSFRLATSSDMVALPQGGHASMNAWEATAAIGYEF